ncbi:MAG: hypothetical protein ACNA8W_21935 [Bradymonadaceae bacterium]
MITKTTHPIYGFLLALLSIAFCFGFWFVFLKSESKEVASEALDCSYVWLRSETIGMDGGWSMEEISGCGRSILVQCVSHYRVCSEQPETREVFEAMMKGEVDEAVIEPDEPEEPEVLEDQKNCEKVHIIELGSMAGVNGVPAAAFHAGRGLLVLQLKPDVLTFATLAPDGQVQHLDRQMTIDPDFRLSRVEALDGGFLILLRKWDIEDRSVRWTAVAVNEDVDLITRTDLPFDDLDTRAVQAEGSTLHALLAPAAVAKERDTMDGRWAMVTLGEGDLHVESGPVDDEHLQRFADPDPDAITLTVRDTRVAVPSTTGRHRHQMPQHVVHRWRNGNEVGVPTPVRTGPLSAGAATWSGTHIIYISRRGADVFLESFGCRR